MFSELISQEFLAAVYIVAAVTVRTCQIGANPDKGKISGVRTTDHSVNPAFAALPGNLSVAV